MSHWLHPAAEAELGDAAVQMTPDSLLVALFFVWLFVGVAWLLSQKLRLIRRVGRHLTNDQLVDLARKGDHEAQRLRRRSFVYVAVGLALLLPLSFGRSILGNLPLW